MKRNYCLFILLFISFSQVSFGQEYQFPKDYLGHWTGELEIYNNEGLTQKLPMELILEPIDSISYTWSLIYGEDKVKGLRAYKLIELNKEIGHFEVDENNSIVLDGYFLGHKFYQQYEVMGNFITLSLERVNKQLNFEIIMCKFDPVRTTGDQIIESDTIPPVQNFGVRISQYAVLKKK